MQKLIFALAFSLLVFASCKDNEVVSTNDFSKELDNSAAVILETYEILDASASQLIVVLTNLENTQTAANLTSAQQSWRDCRVHWEKSEGFLFGPVDQQGIDPAMDSWPVNDVDLENVLNSGLALTKNFMDTQDGTVKGFHTIEYLLFGADGQKKISDFSVREFEYLRACGESLRGETEKLAKSWRASDGNFIKNLTAAGTSASIYPSQKSALQELVNGMVTIADEVANGKINDPFSQKNVLYEESRFSANSKADFADNIRSIQNIYLASTNGTTRDGLATLVKSKNPSLDAKLISQIEKAISDIEGIPGTFTTAIFDQPAAVEKAQTSVRDLLEILQGELLPFVQNL